MSTPILTTKLYIPPVRPHERLVPRPRLIERLNAGLHSGCKLTLISAPAGFGKTMLLSEWVQALSIGTPPLAVAWLSLDERDNNLARFLAYVIAALQTINDSIGRNLMAALQSAQPPPMEVILTSLINEIGAAGPDRLALVLDDYHVIQSSANRAVGFLLERLPPHLHMVIATRQDPPLPLARLRARGQMTEIRFGDLQFSDAETTVFLNEAMGLALKAEEIALLERRTEGWIAGLQLTALALLGPSRFQDREEFIRTFSGDDRYVIDYLGSEVLSAQPEEVQRFLLQTAVLERLCGPLCDAVRFGSAEPLHISPGKARSEGEDGSEGTAINGILGDGQALLEYLDQSNLFVVPLDNRREWYRYHRLFADVLLRRLGQTEPGQVQELHLRASAWYEGEGYHDEAIHHALEAQDLQGAARLVEENALQLLIHSELRTLVRWLDELPDVLIRSRPWLCVYSAWVGLIIGQVEAARLDLQDAQRLSHLAEKEMLGHIAVIRARISLARQDLAQAVKLARQALEYVPERSPLHGHIAVIQGQAAFMRGDLVEASQALTEAASIARDCDHLFMVVDATTRLGYLQTLQGRLRRAIDTYQDALRLAKVNGTMLPVAGNAHIRLALVLRERNELEAASRHLAQGFELCKLFGNPRSAYLALAYLRQAQGDWDGALRAVQDAELQGPGPGATFDLLEVAHCQLWLSLVRSGSLTDLASAPRSTAAAKSTRQTLEAAERWLQECGLTRDGAADYELTFGREQEHILAARALIALDRSAEAARLLARLLRQAEAGGRMGRVIEILVMRALALQTLGDATQALECLERALYLAKPESYVRLFVDEGEAMNRLLRQAASRGIEAEYASKLLAVFVPPARETPTQTLIDPLSERELEVLRLLATSLSSADIAQELTIAVSTVRSHTKSIYSKLNVHRRLDAVERAKKLQLI